MRNEDLSHNASNDLGQSGGIAAHDDYDVIPAGAHAPATGNALSGAGTVSGRAGADALGSGHAVLVSISGAGTSDASPDGGQFRVEGRYGSLRIDSHGNYTYVPNAGSPTGVTDTFTYAIADKAGHQDSARLSIRIEAEKQNLADAQRLTPGPDGVVQLPAGVSLSDVHVVGRDLVIDMPDGTHMIIVDGAVFVPQLAFGGVEVPATNLAALLIDSEPQPAAGTPQSSGGNFAVPVGPLDPGVSLGDLIPPTELNYIPPEFRDVGEFDRNIDHTPIIQIVTPDQLAGVDDAVTSVDEGALGARPGESAGSHSASNAEATSGTIVYTSPDGPNVITLNGTAITTVGQIVHGTYGDLTITSIADGAIGYSYALLENTSGDATHDNFAIVITDGDGDTDSASLTINIIDDVPIANPDVDSVKEGGPTVADGNVLTGSGGGDANTTDGVADAQGADGAHVTGVAHGEATGTLGVPLAGDHGSLLLNADGSYTYTLNGEDAAVRTLGNGDTATDTFTYSITDGDGDVRSTTLTITINGTNDRPSVGSASVAVSEEGTSGGIADGTGFPTVATDTTNSATASGNLSLSDPDGDALTLTLGVPAGSFTSHGVAVTWALSSGGHTLTGSAGESTVITVTLNNAGHYDVTLADQFDHPLTGGEDAFNIVFPVTASDGSLSASGAITVQIEDDMPVIGGEVSSGASVTVDETDAGNGPVWAVPISATSDGAVIAAPVNYGADGPGAAPVYGLVLNSTASGLQTALGDHPITLAISGGTITGTYNDGVNHTAFTVAIDSGTGQVTLTQYVPLEHLVDGSTPAALNDSLNLGDLVSATVTYHDYDGDSVTAATPIGDNLQFLDDGPSVDVTVTPQLSDNEQALYPILQTGDAGTEDTGSTSDSTTANFGGVFGLTAHSGADGAAGTLAIDYSFDLLSSVSGLTSHGSTINLYLVGGVVVGSTAGSAPTSATDASVVFSIAADASGEVTLTQYQQIDHAIGADPSPSGAPFADQISVLGSGLVELVGTSTVIDNDGDSATGSALLDLGGLIRFADDGPSLTSAAGIHSSVTLDETDGANPVSSGAPIVVTSSTAIIAAEVDYGADGQGASTVYGLSLAGGGSSLGSGLQTAVGDHAITLSQTDATTITGSYNDGSDHTAFTVHVNGDGTLTVTQYTALEHRVDGSTPAAFDDALNLSDGAFGSLINASATYSDFDGDTVTATTAIGGAITFLDDGPSVVPQAISATRVEEDELPGGITDGDGFTTVASGSLGGLVDFGGDGPGEFRFNLNGSSLPSTLTSGGDAIHFAVSSDGLTLLAYTGGDSSANQVFTVAITDAASGTYTVSLLAPIDHLPNLPANDDNQTLTIDLSTAVVATDADGDFVRLTSGVAVVIEDDVPAIMPAGQGQPQLTVDETNLTTDDSADFSGAFNANFGADGPGAIPTSYALGIGGAGADSGLVDTLSGETVLLRMNGAAVEGYTAGSNLLVFTVTVDASGSVTLDQVRAVVHNVSSGPDTSEGATLASDTLVTLTGTAHDGDGDSASAVLNIGQNLNFSDDGPTLTSPAQANSSVTLDETDGASPLGAGAPISATSAAAIVAAGVDYGADGPGAATAYGLGLTGGVASLGSGLQTALGDHAITLVQTSATLITATYQDGGTHTAFTVQINADGTLTVTQFTALEHLLDGGTPAAFNDALDLDGLVNATALYSDGDGDTVSGSAAIGAVISFLDDGPSIDVTAGGDAGLSLTTYDGQTIDPATSIASTSAAFGGLFTIGSSDGGGDGTASISPLNYQLGTTGGASGLTSHGLAVNLYNVGGTIVGSTALSAPLSATDASVIFGVGVNGSGVVTLTQYGPIDHVTEASPVPGTGAPFDDQLSALITDSKITLTASATITDNDGDTATDSATIAIGSNLHFADDGPTASLTLNNGVTLRVDETDGVAANAFETDPVGGNLGSTVMPASALFSGGVNYGGDGAGSSSYAMSILADGIASGLLYSPTDTPIVLHMNGAVVEGHVGTTGGALAFTVAIDPSSGAVTLTQFLAVEHFNTASNDEDSAGLTSGALTVTLTATDYDHDTASATADLGSIIRFEDDGPSVSATVNGSAQAVLDETATTSTVPAIVLASYMIGNDPDVAGAGAISKAVTLGAVVNSTVGYGADGQGAPLAYTLQIGTAASGLTLTDGSTISLHFDGSSTTTIVGVADSGAFVGKAAFAIQIDPATGVVTVEQYLSLHHGDITSYDETVSMLAGHVGVVVTATDSDGDKASSTTADISGQILFHDDGPTASVNGAVPKDMLVLDESRPIGGDTAGASAPGGLATVTANFADNFGTSTYGADGPGTVSYGMMLASPTVASGLYALDSSDKSTSDGDGYGQGAQIMLSISGGVVTGSVGATNYFTIAANNTGVVTFTQLANIWHPTPGSSYDEAATLTAAANSLLIQQTVTDGDGDSAKASIDLSQGVFTIQDDGPHAANDSAVTTETTQDFNTAFVLDFSSSIDNGELNTMLTAVKAAGAALFAGTTGDVTVRLVAFASTALSFGPFTSYAALAAQIDAVNPAAGGTRPLSSHTDYTAGIHELLTFYAADPTADNRVFFLSDGNPNEELGTHGEALNATTAQAWHDFVIGNDVEVTSIGIGNGIQTGPLQQIDVDGHGAPILVNAFSDLIATLIAQIQPHAVSGNVLTNDSVGTDGGHIQSIVVDGTTYAWDAGTTITKSSGGTIAGDSLNLTTTLGGHLVFHFADGSWSYTPPANVAATTNEVFTYTLVDGDKDTSSAALTITVQNDNEPTTSPVSATVDDEGLAGGILGGTGDFTGPAGSEAIATGNLGLNYGVDGPGTVSFADMQGLTALVGTETVKYGWDSITHTLTAIIESGSRVGTALFNVQITDATTGAYKVTLLDNVLHVAGLNENDAGPVVLTYKIGDSNGTTTSGTLALTFDDDTPTTFVPDAVTVINNNSAPVTKFIDTDHLIGNNLGADGGTVRFAVADGSGSGMTSGGSPIIYHVSADGQTLYGDVGATHIFTVTLNQGASTYTLDMNGTIDSLTTIQYTAANSDFIGGNKGWYGIVPTGQGSAPADDNSHDLLITPDTTGSSINSSGILGGVGSGQSLGAGESFRVDYVVDLTGSPPNNYTAGSASGAVFDQHFTTNGATIGFRQSTGTTLQFTASDDLDSNNVVGEAGNHVDVVTGITLIYKADVTVAGVTTTQTAASGLLAVTAVHQTYTAFAGTTSTHTYTYYLAADGKSVIVENVSGGSGNSGPPDTIVGVFTGDGYNSLDVKYISGDTVKFEGFGATVQSTDPVHFSIPVQIVDGDGDIVAGTAIAVTANAATPVTLDTNHDGQVSYLGTDAGVLYDMNHDGSLDHTAWVASGDSILFRDADHNGSVSNSTEFVFGHDGLTDMQALHAQYGDQLNAGDADFSQFAVWNDANSNGLVDAGEVQSLADAGITSIGLVSDGVLSTQAGGDVQVAGTASFIYVNDNGDIAQGKAEDATFAYRSVSSDLEQRLAGATTGYGVVAAAVAAMGLVASAPAAASSSDDAHQVAMQTSSAGGTEAQVSAPAASIDETNHSLIQSEERVVINDEVQTHSAPTDAPAPADHNVSNEAPQVSQPAVIADNDDGGPATDTASSMVDVAPAVVMAEAAALAPAAVDHVAVGKVVAAALDDGGDLDKLLANLPAPPAQAVAQALASHGGGAVPAWDSGHFSGFTAQAVPTIAIEAMMLHHDAAPAA